MAACTYPFENLADPIVAEARACLQVITFMKELLFPEIIVEGDALTIIKKLRSDEKDISIVSFLINEIKEWVNSFILVKFRYIPRQGNDATHLLVEKGRRYATPMFWIEAPRVVEAEVERNREAMQGA
ncbi:hypothetical protein Goshw_006096, partial [Gossypium schwendimanii]|nr:hypothetical protein [Gossypium schwendimanii]